MYHYLSLGSNIDAEKNMGACIERLLVLFKSLYLYPCVYTLPENMPSNKRFINTLAVIESKITAPALKKRLEDIEVSLGRNRGAPDRSRCDRECDIDILASSKTFDLFVFAGAKDAYLSTVYHHRGTSNETASIRVFGLRLPERPATINLEGGAGHEITIDYELNGLVNR